MPSYICLNMLTLTCSLHIDVLFVQYSPCKYFLQIAIYVCLYWHAFHAKCLFSTLNLWDHMQVMINSTWDVYAHPKLEIVFGCVPSMVERLSLILSTEVSMRITYLNMQLEIVDKLCGSINMLLPLIAITKKFQIDITTISLYLQSTNLDFLNFKTFVQINVLTCPVMISITSLESYFTGFDAFFCVYGIIVYIWNTNHITWPNMSSKMHMYLLGFNNYVLVNASLYWWM